MGGPAGQGVADKVVFTLTHAVVVRFIASGTLAALTLFFLSTGRKNNDPERLFWAAVSALAALGVLVF
jgi:hypothetical protein